MENSNRSSEDIDLGHLFKLIGDGFNQVYQFFIRLFLATFSAIISFFIFIQIHFWKFLVAGTVGALIGFVLDSRQEDAYRSIMTVEPNLGSTRQLYSNISMYNELVRAEDTLELARIFNITPSHAGSITNFSVEALVSKHRMLTAYNQYLISLDSTARNVIDFKDYVEEFDPLDAETHSIMVDATNDRVAKLLENTIISSINNNAYYKLKKETTDQNIDALRGILRTQIKDIDTLKGIYTEVILNASKPEPSSGGTSISFSEKEVKTKEFELLKETRDISKEIQQLNVLRVENKDIINVISTFPDRGVRFRSWNKRRVVFMPIMGILLTLLFLLLYRFDRYLRAYKSKNNY